MKKFLLIVGIVAVVVGAGIYFAAQDSKPVTSNDFASVPRDTQLLNNMNKAGLEGLAEEGTVLHIHQHIDLVVDGQKVEIPAEIGIGSTFISPLHTHDVSGILHVESPEQKDFKLSQFFDEWGVDFNDQCIATHCTNDSDKLQVYVNGNQIQNARDYVLKAHDEIYIWYGPKDQNPDVIKEFSFPANL
jgi:hypothetical protein